MDSTRPGIATYHVPLYAARTTNSAYDSWNCSLWPIIWSEIWHQKVYKGYLWSIYTNYV